MPRKVFLSFLGISNYKPVSYHLETAPPEVLSPPVKFVQAAILDALAVSFSPGDHAFIFLTKEARLANWSSDTGLEKDLRDRKLSFPVSPIDVEGKSEENAIWTTFQSVFDCLKDNDEVFLDITHSWRYLPMLGMTLLNYAKALKHIQVKAIYYGALEQLGTPGDVGNLPFDQRPVPILNLVSFSELQDWALAADDLIQDGNPTRLSLLTHQRLVPFLAETKGKDEIVNNLRAIQVLIQKLTPLIQTNRGLEIWKFPYSSLHDALSLASQQKKVILNRSTPSSTKYERKWQASNPPEPCNGWKASSGASSTTSSSKGSPNFRKDCLHGCAFISKHWLSHPLVFST